MLARLLPAIRLASKSGGRVAHASFAAIVNFQLPIVNYKSACYQPASFCL